MTQATVKTIQYIDPRIEPQPDPVYDYVVGPMQNQYYKIPASGLSNSSITFNNLTTLGIDRAYLDTFEIELTVDFTFNLNRAPDHSEFHIPIDPASWTFDSFPFNKCCEEARVNINGGAFFSQPLSYIRAKERYMNQEQLAKCYENICPCYRPICQTESGRNYNESATQGGSIGLNSQCYVPNLMETAAGQNAVAMGRGVPTRYGAGCYNHQSQVGNIGGFNNDIVQYGENMLTHVHMTPGGGGAAVDVDIVEGTNYHMLYDRDAGGNIIPSNKYFIRATWREPIFCSPFSSRYDATYGRPLYNITSMDINFTLQNLGNMIRYCNYFAAPGNGGAADTNNVYVTGYSVDIKAAQLCYQVMTIPPVLNKPLTTLVPYRRFVPYITDYNASNNVAQQGASAANVDINGQNGVTMRSGIYSLNEIPTAIWIFVGPTKADLQYNQPDYFYVGGNNAPGNNIGNYAYYNSYDTNRLFAYIKHVDISLANTTQILNTADVPDLYRIAKANGCEDSYWSWAGNNTVSNIRNSYNIYTVNGVTVANLAIPTPKRMYYGAGSVLRLKPGVDLIVPDQALIPGANGNNMVFQANVTVDIPPHSQEHSKYALWLLFEYVGVAAISPGQCEITMNPIGSGEVMTVSPVVSATSEATEGELEGSGFWDKVKKSSRISSHINDKNLISSLLKRIPGAGGAAKWVEKHGLGEPANKRQRDGCAGGAVMGRGLNDWV